MRNNMVKCKYAEKSKKNYRADDWDYLHSIGIIRLSIAFPARNYFFGYRAYSRVYLLSESPLIDKKTHRAPSTCVFRNKQNRNMARKIYWRNVSLKLFFLQPLVVLAD